MAASMFWQFTDSNNLSYETLVMITAMNDRENELYWLIWTGITAQAPSSVVTCVYACWIEIKNTENHAINNVIDVDSVGEVKRLPDNKLPLFTNQIPKSRLARAMKNMPHLPTRIHIYKSKFDHWQIYFRSALWE